MCYALHHGQSVQSHIYFIPEIAYLAQQRLCPRTILTAAQAVVILIVCDFDGLTQDEITKRLSLDKSVIAKTVTKLEETGLSHPFHQRKG